MKVSLSERKNEFNRDYIISRKTFNSKKYLTKPILNEFLDIIEVILKQHQTNEELEREIKYTKDGRYRLRVQAILLAQKGLKSHEISEQLKIGKDTFFNWKRWYNEKG